jgi:hypothetical protein
MPGSVSAGVSATTQNLLEGLPEFGTEDRVTGIETIRLQTKLSYCCIYY